MTGLRFFKCKNDHVTSLGCCVGPDSFTCDVCGEDCSKPISWNEASAIMMKECEHKIVLFKEEK